MNIMWVLLSAALVFFMQAGFMCLECGLASAKNSINVAVKNLADFMLSCTLFWVVGFGLMFGASASGIIGTSDFLIGSDDPWRSTFFVFQAVFAGTAATILSGAVAGRVKFSAYLIVSAVVSALIYPVFGHWAWGSFLNGGAGWLEALGFKDFAGSTVVHSVGGWVALVVVWWVGPRIGRFDRHGNAQRIPPHNLTLAYLGAFILFLGWFGFNGGSTLKASGEIGGIVFNTMLGGCFGAIAAATLSWWHSPLHRPEAEMLVNGLLGGLVGITAGCAFVPSWAAALIGLGAGVVVYFGTLFLERTLKLDDVVGAVPVHAMCGVWGTLSVGLFIRESQLGEMSRLAQIGVQALGAGVAFVWAAGIALVVCWLLDLLGGQRVTPEEERLGLNISEHGATSTILDLAQAMHHATARGDFTDSVKVEEEIGTEAGDLARGFNRMIDAVRAAMVERDRHSADAQNALEEVERERTRHEENRRAYISRTTGEVRSIVSRIQESFNRMARSASGVTDAIGDLRSQSLEINKVVEIIRTLGRQINLLSLNAMIESAKAGEHGRTFSVVADEVRHLGVQTEGAVKHVVEITSLIQDGLAELVDRVHTDGEEVKVGLARLAEAEAMVNRLEQVSTEADNALSAPQPVPLLN